MWIAHLSLRNFRNYRLLELSLSPGLVVVVGGNAQGKTNLLEALYLLSIMKSFRVPTERELINWEAAQELAAATVTCVAQGRGERLRVHLALQPLAVEPSPERPGPQVVVQKHVRVNGAPRSAAAAVGRINAVLFSATDLEVVLGSPAMRRRYLDVLLCQMDNGYLRTLQRYQRVLAQRNHLLRRARESRSGLDEELRFWDQELVTEGAQIIQRRGEAVRELAALAVEAHGALSGGEVVVVEYLPSVGEGARGLGEVEEAFRQGLHAQRRRELAQGATVVGPHRDDLSLKVQGMPVASHGSRGQARTLALALRLAEAELLARRRGEGPVLLLDDVLSELDPQRRRQVLEWARRYEQVFVTTADQAQLGADLLAQASRLMVRGAAVESLNAPQELVSPSSPGVRPLSKT